MKKLLSLILSASLLIAIMPLSVLPVVADNISGDFTYTVSDGKATITGCDREISGNVVIPSELDGYPVTAIGGMALWMNPDLTSITIPDSIIFIGESAFYSCPNLAFISLPNTVMEIGGSAFSGTAYYNNSANWENDLLYIGNHLVEARPTISGNCTIKSGTKTIANNTFDMAAYGYHSDLTGISIPDSVERIGVSAFRGCDKLTSITVPGNVKTIGAAAFDNCKSLIDIMLPDSVMSIGVRAFSGTAYYNNSANWENDVLYIGKHLIEAKSTVIGQYNIKPGTKTIGDFAFEEHVGLISVTLPNSLVSIGNDAFSGCKSLRTAMLPDSIINIGNRAFYRCSSLSSITMPNHVESIGDEAFCDCNISSITIPVSTTYIGVNAFGGCGLKNIFVDSSNKNYCAIDDVLFSKAIDRLVLYPENKQDTSYIIPSSVTNIGNYAFYNCRGLTSIVIPNRLKAIETGAFGNCIKLTYLTIPNSVIYIGNYAFDHMNHILKVYELSYAHIYALENSVNFYLLSMSAPNAPEIENIAESNSTITVTLKATAGYEYRCNNGSWQKDNVFTNLSKNDMHVFYQRIAESEQHVASDISRGTPSAPMAPTAEKIEFESVTLTPNSNYEYRCDNGSWQKSNVFSNLNDGTAYTFYQRVAETEDYVASSSSPGKSITTKEKAANSTTVPTPIVSNSTASSITLKPQANCEYSKDGTTWQKSNTFTGIVSGQQYTFYQRIAATDTVKAGPVSVGRKVKILSAGDLDGDKKITDWDGVLLARHLAGWNIKVSGSSVMDVDGDGKVTDWDGVMFDRYLAGWNVTVYVGGGQAISTYIISYENLKGAENKNPSTYDSGSKIALASPTVKHYTFSGWYCGDKKVTQITGTEETDLTLTAKWTPIKYKVTYINSNGNNNVINSTYTADSNYPMSVSDTSSKYFIGWFDENGNQIYHLDPDKGDVTLTARWGTIKPLVITTSGSNSIKVTQRYIGGGMYAIEVSLTVMNVTGEDYVGFEIRVNGQTRASDGIKSSYGQIHNIFRTIYDIPGGDCHVHVIIQ